MPLGTLDGFVECGVGSFTIMRREERWEDPSTGATVAGGDVVGSSEILTELGIGLRTRRNARFDWMLGLRRRGHSQVEGESGESMQVRIGIVTR